VKLSHWDEFNERSSKASSPHRALKAKDLFRRAGVNNLLLPLPQRRAPSRGLASMKPGRGHHILEEQR
jgi:hypothetical protein